MALSRSACLTARSSARVHQSLKDKPVLFGQQGNATLKIRRQMHLHPIFPGLPATLRQLREQRLLRSVWTAGRLAVDSLCHGLLLLLPSGSAGSVPDSGRPAGAQQALPPPADREKACRHCPGTERRSRSACL